MGSLHKTSCRVRGSGHYLRILRSSLSLLLSKTLQVQDWGLASSSDTAVWLDLMSLLPEAPSYWQPRGPVSSLQIRSTCEIKTRTQKTQNWLPGTQRAPGGLQLASLNTSRMCKHQGTRDLDQGIQRFSSHSLSRAVDEESPRTEPCCCLQGSPVFCWGHLQTKKLPDITKQTPADLEEDPDSVHY